MQDEHVHIQREPDDSFDRILRSELRWEAPPELTSCLLALVPGADASVTLQHAAQPAAPPRPQGWYATVVFVLTAVAIGLSMAVAWQFYSAVGAQFGLGEMWSQLQAAPAIGLQRLYDMLPASRYLIALLIAVRDQLHWLLVTAVLWLALDGWSPNVTLRRT